MNYLIAGLGNPGAEYENTRHNAGFLVVDHLAARFQAEFERVQQGFLSEFRHKGRKF
ncbi:MAG: aminoacyl-tRNA hydrolase, partial [Bacteroidetes bacterium]